jgi:L-ascorbate metabolism protein UlaG (beta-lactamase superfamily)
MKKKAILGIIAAFAFAGSGFTAGDPESVMKMITWYGQSSLRIDTGKAVIYIDPVKVSSDMKADAILVTHSHGDHYSKADIEKLSKKGTRLITSFAAEGAEETAPGKKFDINGISVEAVPAYNIVKANKHPKANGFVGYILTIDGVRVYHAGDTERIPEMKNFKADIAFLPLGQKYTMNSVEEAVDAAVDVKAKIAVPMHFGKYEGTAADALKFEELATKKGIKVKLLKEN